jgi:hypothetical protein
MKRFCILCVVVGVGLSGTAAFARGGMGSSHMSTMGGPMMSSPMAGNSTMGGAFGTSAATPGTNSLGTALSSSGTGRAMTGALLGTDPAIDREEAKVDKMIGSICRGC